MPLFLSDEEYERLSPDAAAVAAKAEEFIRQQLDTVRAQADAEAITAEQTCSSLEQKFVSLSSEFTKRESENSALAAELERKSAELAQVIAEKHQININIISKEGDIERLGAEASELQKSKKQFTVLLGQKDSEISEKNALIKTYLDKILNLTDTISLRESRLNEVEADLARANASCTRLSQEKELVERHNTWLNNELEIKVNNVIELRKTYAELEAELSSKIADLERKLSESSSSLKWNKDNVIDLEKKLKSVQEELSACQDTAAVNEERHCAEMATVNKLVELYKESSQEWSKKAGELEGVIKALETHSSQVENDYKERLEKELTARKEFEKEAALLKEKLDKCEAEVETSRRTSEINLLPWSTSSPASWVNPIDEHDTTIVGQMVVPSVPSGVSGTALAASLLRDGWSLVKMYTKYQEAVDALRHEQLGRKQSQAILERVLYEIEEKAAVIMDERAEHERFVEAYSVMNEKLQNSLSEQNTLERTIKELKADLRRCERDSSIAHKEVIDLQKQVTILLKECQDVQLRGRSVCDVSADDSLSSILELNAETESGKVISGRLLAYKDIHGLVDQNVQLRSLARKLSDQIESTEMELKEKFKMELQKRDDEAAAKVNAVLARAEEQGQMIESLHTSVAMYKRLYEEEHRQRSPYQQTKDINQGEGRNNLMLLLEDSQEGTKKAQQDATERVRCLEDDLVKLRSEIRSLRAERDKFAKEAEFSLDKLDRNLKELEHQRDETNAVISRNVEFSQLIIDYQRKLRESSESVQAAEDCSRKLNMEVSVLRCEKEMLANAEKRACSEVHSLSERVYRLQASLDTLQSTEEAREEANRVERRKQDEYLNQIQKEWAQAKKDLDDERARVQQLIYDREEIRKSSFKQVEEMRKDLSRLSNAVTAAEARAAAAEAQNTLLEKNKYPITPIAGRNSQQGVSSTHTNEDVADLHVTREEIESLREEVQVNKAHMLQYKSIAQVNEEALKQMELAHENFKLEADKVRMSLEAELVSLKEQFNELECEYGSKLKEAFSSGAARDADLNSALSEIEQLKLENSSKMSQIVELEIQISTLKDDLDKEHKNRRDAQTNYERQVILQSETIQELTKTSGALALLQEEISELRKLSDELKSENSELKSRWDVERSMLEESKVIAEKRYHELDEQNKILHSRLEALHIKLAENDRDSAGIPTGSTDQTLPDAGLQNVVSYLRRSKEIAETEISLLKQEKLRMQSQLESALRAAESAQASIQAVRANSRAMLYTEDEFKSLQLQVREVNLLRESNIQLREENKHNFEECQKLREVAQKARMESEQLNALLREKQIELEASKKEYQIQKSQKDLLSQRVEELLEKCRNNTDVEDYHRIKDDIKQMQATLSEKDVQLEDVKKQLQKKDGAISELEKELAKIRKDLNERESKLNEKDGAVSELEKDLAKIRKELSEKEGKLNESLQVQVPLRRNLAQFKKKVDFLTKEKEELRKQNEALSKQSEDLKQGRKDIVDEVMKEKEKEKDTRVQMLEKTVERQREELKAEKDKRQKTERTVLESIMSTNQEKIKWVDEFEKHKQAVEKLVDELEKTKQLQERLADEVEKLKHAKNSLPEGTSVIQSLSGTLLEDLLAAYMSAIEAFERVAHSVASELVVPLTSEVISVGDASASVTSGQALPLQAPSPVTKPTEEQGKKSMSSTANPEPRKIKRTLLRRPKKNDGPQVDTEMPEVEQSNKTEKPMSSQISETKVVPTQQDQPLIRKRLAPSTSSDPQDDSLVPPSASSGVEAPALKKPKGSDSLPRTTEDNVETMSPPSVQEPSDVTADRPQTPKEESMDTEKNDGETGGEQDEDQKLDTTNEIELQTESIDILEEFETNQIEPEVAEEEIQQSTMESENEREEGEMLPDAGDVGEEMAEDQTDEPEVPPVSSPLVDDYIVDPNETTNDDADLNEANEDGGDEINQGETEPEAEPKAHQNPVIMTPDTTDEPKKEADEPKKGASQNPQSVASDPITGEPKKEEKQNPGAASETIDKNAPGAVSAESAGLKEGSSSSVAQEGQEPRQASPVGRTINLQERAKLRSAMRQQTLQQQGQGSTPPPPAARGRGRLVRGRVRGRGQGSGGGRG